MPNRQERLAVIEALQQARGGTKVISLITSTRPGLEVQMAMDQVDILYEHLRPLRGESDVKIDLFLHTNGGDGIVPWRLVSLLREFTQEFAVLVAHRAFSAGTLVAMGADDVLMGPMGMLGPIDPTVTTPYNPPNPQNPAERLGISVEDVSSFIALVKEDVGIRHEEELVQAFNILANQVNPLALGNVKRSTSQARIMGVKLLRTRGSQLDEHAVTEIVEKLASQLYYHGHPINRREARDDLKLDFVRDAEPQVEDAMWALHRAYAEDMELLTTFDVVAALCPTLPAVPSPPPMAGPGQLGATTIATHAGEAGPFTGVRIESVARSDRFAVSFDGVVSREWTGATNAQYRHKGQWEQEA